MARGRRQLAAFCLALLHPAASASASAAEGGADESCPAGAPCSGSLAAGGPVSPPVVDEGPEYPWPTVRGRMKPGLYSISPHKAPRNWEKKLAWEFPGARGDHSTVFNGGVSIDDEGNIYTAATDAIYKLSRQGELKWLYPVATSTTPVIHGGALYSNSKDGKFFKLDMKTGLAQWTTTVGTVIGSDISGMGISEGVVIGSSSHGHSDGGDSQVMGVNASSGEVIWSYRAQAQLWNFQPIFTGEGSFVFQDQIGGVYHMRTGDGELLWKSGYQGSFVETWTDGILMLGPNRIVYAPHADCVLMGMPSASPQCTPVTPGTLTAYSLDTGERIWSQVTPYSPNSQPVVVKLGKNPGYSVVMPIGMPAMPPPSTSVFSTSLPMVVKIFILELSIWLGDSQAWLWKNTPYPSVVQTYDAQTGEKQWSWTPPSLVRGYSAGDEELLQARSTNGAQILCIPNLWASPTVDAEGTIFMAHANGKIYALRDTNEDNAIDPSSEVTEFDTKVAFGHPGPAFADGMMAVVNCDRVLVFKD